MCGIAGAIDLTGNREFSPQRLLAMTTAIAHRGPDDEHIHLEPGLALGARRLAIVDLTGGRQPLSNEDGSIWVAFNGELFEYPELRSDLLASGHQFATRCDTEAWVHLYEQHGCAMFEKARGQFAVSLWDRNTRTLILGRDRVGICPLYYAQTDGWLLWGSEIRALLASGLFAIRPDARGIDHFLTFFSAGTSRTFFEGIKSLPPGHFLAVRDGRITQNQYWDLAFPDTGCERRLDDPTPLIEEFESILQRAVKIRLRGDVPVASYISGGLDSTVILGMCSQQRSQAIPSFTIGLDRAGPDERTQAAEAAAVLNSPLLTTTVDQAAIATAYPDLVRATECPVLDTSCAALLRLAESVHDRGYKVVLTGEGADEALAGYVWYKGQAWANTIARYAGSSSLSLIGKLIKSSVAGFATPSFGNATIGGVKPVQLALYEMISLVKPVIYSSEMKERLAGHDPYSDLDIRTDCIKQWHPLNQSLYTGYKIMLPGMLLHSKGDRIAMNASVETRYPYLDEDVIAFCAGIAPEYKLRGMTEKWILRQVAARTLPHRIANRPKTMFRTHMASTFLGPHRPRWVDQLLSQESLLATGYFNPEMVLRQRAWQSHIPKITPARFVYDVALTSIVAIQLWHHIFCGGGLCELPTGLMLGPRHAIRTKSLARSYQGAG